MKKLLFVTLFLTTLIGCGGNAFSNNDDKTEIKDIIKIGITQIVKHPSLDMTRKGVEDAINESKYKDQVVFDYQNAKGSFKNAKTIAKNFNKNDDIIVPISTPSAQAALSEIKTKPLFLSGVTIPATSLLDGKNVTGTIDMSPADKQVELIQTLLPDAQTIGTIYTKNEANSVYSVEEFTKAAEKAGYKVIAKGIKNTDEIASVMDSLINKDKIDVLYTCNDNNIATAYSKVVKVANKFNLPIIGTNEVFTTTGALASSGISEYEVGRATGEMIIEYLDGSKVDDVPIRFFKTPKFTINHQVMKKYGITLTEEQKENMKIVNTVTK